MPSRSLLHAFLVPLIFQAACSFAPTIGAPRRYGIAADATDAVEDDSITSDIATTATAAAAGVTAASAVVTAAGTVCATGACTAAATTAVTGTAGAGLLSQLAYPIAALGLSGALALQSGPEGLADQAAHSALYADAMRTNHPVVLEFYSQDCRHCRHAASNLAEVSGAHPGVD